MFQQLCPGLFSTRSEHTAGTSRTEAALSRRSLRLVRLGATLLLACAATLDLVNAQQIWRGVGTPALHAQAPGERPEFSWPIVKGEYPRLRGLTSTFGESRVDHFHNGLDIAASGDPVHPVAPGFILYSRTPSDDPFAPEQGPGNFVYLYHGQGWYSGYYHLQSGEALVRSGNVKPTTPIGQAGNTGHSGGPHLHFFITAENGRKIINPLYLLPPATDENPPIIGQINIITPAGRTLVSHSRAERIRLTKRYPILLNIIDPGLEPYTRRGVYRLSWKLKGGVATDYNFSSITYRDGDWRLEGGQVFDQVFQYNLYKLNGLEFQNGRNELIVRAEDHSGNITEVLFDVTVDREY
ncbi:MAG: M23 family metallopeptidase [bacterium]|nr:M23 family metallopeptidase [bacterium]